LQCSGEIKESTWERMRCWISCSLGEMVQVTVAEAKTQLAALREALPEQQASGVETMQRLRDESRP
jgi:hypothetical protein